MPSIIQFDKPENYQLNNYTGSFLTTEMIAAYSKTINDAYSYFINDLRLSSEYIASQLGNKYNYAYSVVILLTNENVGNWYIYTFGDGVICWINVNTYQPNWIYIIWPRYKYSSQTADYISGLGKGIGINEATETVIRNIIKAQE